MTIESFSSQLSFSGKTETPAVPASVNNTDVVAPEFRLYIEGVQVPFETISINQSYGRLPDADIQVPPQSGLMDIIRGYSPKVHIFYRDDNEGGLRLLFWGFIQANSYMRSRSSGTSFITFKCTHKNDVLRGLTLDFTGWASNTNVNLADPNVDSAFKPAAFNSVSMIIAALEGITDVASISEAIRPGSAAAQDAPTFLLDPTLKKLLPRFQGMPGVAVNIWNQIRKAAYAQPAVNPAIENMYAPLIDEGIAYFKRMSGHPLLERQIQDTKSPYCNKKSYKETDILIPPIFRNPFLSAVQSELAVKSIFNLANFSGELTTFPDLLESFLNEGCQYDLLTLASPAEVSVEPDFYTPDVNQDGVEKMAVETIVKPVLPFYYSPTCNVILPRMYSSISVNQDESVVPTRVSASHDAMIAQNGPNSIATSYKGPASHREATAYTQFLTKNTETGADIQLSLEATKGYSYFSPSKYEQGSGIRHTKIYLPWWLVLLNSDKSSQGSHKDQEKVPTKGDGEYKKLLLLSADWKARYGGFSDAKKGLNPYDIGNTSVMPHERIMYATVDYEYSQRRFNSRNGNVECVFNPYIIPGYPMDVIDDSPNHPSFHAFCVSVTHSITPRGCATNVAMINVVSYAELSNYYMPPTTPFLNTALGIINGDIDEKALEDSTEPGDTSSVQNLASVLIQNPLAKEKADTFYRQVLGVGAAAPDDLIHFESNRAYELQRGGGVLNRVQQPGTGTPANVQNFSHTARTQRDYYTTVGNLRLVSRAIESKASIEEKFGYKFIDLTKVNYNNASVNYVNPQLASDLFLEPGASLFLDYQDTLEFLKPTRGTTE